MASGLGENTPIVLKFTRDNFNAMIGRHGQFVRWLSSNKCPCVGKNKRADENCEFCKGKGISYSDMYSSEDIKEYVLKIDGVVELNSPAEIIWVRDLYGNDLDYISGECSTILYVLGIVKGKSVYVKYRTDSRLTGENTPIYISPGVYEVGLPVKMEFGTTQGTLYSAVAYNVTQDIPLTTESVFRNRFTVSPIPEETDEITVTYKYINPLVFGILNQNLTDTDRKWLTDLSGDAIMIFPQKYLINEEDIIIALNSTIFKNHVFSSTGENEDSLPSFYIDNCFSTYSIRDGVKVNYEYGTDYVLSGGNKIKWITLNKPLSGETVSINYVYNLTYKVLKDSPNPRTSENNRFPRKVMLKLYTDYNPREDF